MVSYLLAVTDEKTIWKRLKKLPFLLPSPFIATAVSIGLAFIIPEPMLFPYYISSAANLLMCTLWVQWTWRLDFLRAFSAVCMAAVLQVATTSLAQIYFLIFPTDSRLNIKVMTTVLLFSAAAAALLKLLRFGARFRWLLEDQSNLHRNAALMFALELSMEAFLLLQNGVRRQYLVVYYILVIVLVIVAAGLIVYLAYRFDANCTLQIQRDIIAQQQLYEQNLEDIHREVRSFRHDYKNLLASLSQQADEGKLDTLRSMLSELDADFDRNLGKKIQFSTQIGNLQIPQVRSLLLGKLTDLRKNDVECRLEVLYPVETVGMNIWDFVRCLGILTDNAAEAALETEQPWVEIILLAQSGQIFLRVSNPYVNLPDPGKIWNEGWSTKGPGRGLGLSGYLRILERYPNAIFSTTWDGGIFTQELTVEDNT